MPSPAFAARPRRIPIRRPGYRCARGTALGAALGVALLLGGCGDAGAPQFRIERVTAHLADDAVVLTAGVDLSLSEEAVAALGNGVPLVLLTDLALVHTRPLLWDRSVARWRLRAEIRYHALSGRYVLSRSGHDDPETFLTAQEAIAQVGRMRRLRFPLPQAREEIAPGEGYELGMRVRLDIEALPAPLRPLAYVSPAWRMNSSWTRWPTES